MIRSPLQQLSLIFIVLAAASTPMRARAQSSDCNISMITLQCEQSAPQPAPAQQSAPQSLPPPAAPSLAPTSTTLKSTGSGVVIGAHGEVLTNAHVVENCANIIVRSSSSSASVASLVARDERNDLAVVRSNLSLSSVVMFREGSARMGDRIVALGYPLSGILATGPNLTVGNVSALAGLGDDSRYLQISSAVQPGNSGGPLLDESGHLIGIVTAKLDALRIARVTGDVPQMVNFALKAEVARTFLDSKGIVYQTARSEQKLSPADVGDIARPFTVQIECRTIRDNPHDEAKTAPTPPLPPVQQVKALPACESTSVTDTLAKIGNSRGIEVFKVDPRTLPGTVPGITSDMRYCTALAWTSSGKLAVNYAVYWTNRDAGRFWVTVCFGSVCN